MRFYSVGETLLNPIFILVILRLHWMLAQASQNKPNKTYEVTRISHMLRLALRFRTSHHQTFTALIWFDQTDFKHIHF